MHSSFKRWQFLICFAWLEEKQNGIYGEACYVSILDESIKMLLLSCFVTQNDEQVMM
jgi:hypothetical protein